MSMAIGWSNQEENTDSYIKELLPFQRDIVYKIYASEMIHLIT
jgi:hypothetical protein